MTLHLVQDFPEVRTCPWDTLRRLRELDATADVLYLGDGRWLFGSVVPDSRRARGAQRALEVLAQRPVALRDAAWHRKWHLAQAKRQGFKPRAVLETEPGGDLVNRLRLAQWDHLHTSDSQFFQQLDEARRAEEEALHKDLVDPDRAKEAWKYTFNRSHAPGVSLTPTLPVPSGRTRHTVSAA